MAEALLEIADLTKRFGGLTANDALSLDVTVGELHAVIGPNGAGKTTLIAQLSGELKPDTGTIRFAGEEIAAVPAAGRVHRGLARSFQIPQLLSDYTACENVALAAQARAGHSYRFWSDARRNRSLRDAGMASLRRVGLTSRADVAVRELSHGEQKQLELAIALATGPRMLLLDEPMAGLGAVECTDMIDLLRQLKQDITILLVEHDMDAVFALADRVSVLVNGQRVATGTSEQVKNDPTVRTAYLGEGGV
jgi:branched-chain amino acid transport system ATP-binding protein